MAALSLIFDIIARDNASRGFNDVGDAADKAGNRGKAFGALLGGAAVAGVGALVVALKGGADEFKGNQEAIAQFEAGIKSTGGASKVTADQIVSLADSIEAKTGTDGAAVVSGAALLETFTKVRNEVGAGNDVFTRATTAGVDLAARGFGSVESNAVLLGKALNDPLKGLTALGKQGITFTADQKKTIESLVKTGDVLGAQKIILKEVEGQVGGSAAAYGQTLPGQLARASAAFDGVKETLFKAVLPAITIVLEYVTGKLIPGFQSLAEKVEPAVTRIATVVRDQIIPALQTAAGAVTSFVGAIPLPILQTVGGVLGVIAAALAAQAIASAVAAAATGAYAAVTALFATSVNVANGSIERGLIARLAYNVSTIAGTVASGAAAAATFVLSGAVGALNAVLALNPITLVVIALVALVAALVIAYKNSETFRNIVNAAFDKVKAAGKALADFVTVTIPAAFETVRAKVAGALESVKTAVSTGFDAVIGFATGLPGRIGGALASLGTTLFNVARAALGRFVDAEVSGITTIVTTVAGIGGRIVGGIGNLGSLLYSAGGDLLRGLANGITGAIGGVIDAAKRAAQAAVSAVKGALGINSPSRVFAELGGFAGQGLALGLDDSQRLVGQAAANLVDVGSVSTTSTVGFAGGAGAGAGGNDELLAELRLLRAEFVRQNDRRLQLARSGAI